ncbi:MAG: hypothetical protein Kow0098_16150 [Ignavibacteriaceae bacterium]
MILDLIVIKSDDGFTAEMPSIKGCESWAHDEDSAISKTLELAGFYLKTDPGKFRIDKARKTKQTTVYKIVFDKSYQ